MSSDAKILYVVKQITKMAFERLTYNLYANVSHSNDTLKILPISQVFNQKFCMSLKSLWLNFYNNEYFPMTNLLFGYAAEWIMLKVLN